jgi:hypothetical protein
MAPEHAAICDVGRHWSQQSSDAGQVRREVDFMPQLIAFMLTRLSIGFALGILTALAIWSNGFAPAGSAASSDYYVAQAVFLYLFGSTIALGYLATALWLDKL